MVSIAQRVKWMDTYFFYIGEYRILTVSNMTPANVLSG